MEELLVKVGSEVKKGDPLASISTENLKELIGTAHLYMAIKECHKEHGFPVEAACELIHVARSAYYKWASGKLSHRTAENEKLADKIERIYLENP
ncbi:MAG: hypothetical protein MR999_05895, partial [Flintibacter sp.]|nr:hypothetical protein [Flintibacter sp.]